MADDDLDDDLDEDDLDDEDAEDGTDCPNCDHEDHFKVTCSECSKHICDECEAQDGMGRPLNPPLCEDCSN